jgi:hypothetical protein
MGIKIIIELTEDATVQDLKELEIEFDDLESRYCIKDIKITENKKINKKDYEILEINDGDLIPHYCNLCDIGLKIGHYRFNQKTQDYTCSECIEGKILLEK